MSITPFWDRLRAPVATPTVVDPNDNPLLRGQPLWQGELDAKQMEDYRARIGLTPTYTPSGPADDSPARTYSYEDTVDRQSYEYQQDDAPDYEDEAVEVRYSVVGVEDPGNWGRFLDPASVLSRSGAQAAQEEVQSAWEAILDVSGLSDLDAQYGLETNWWPGLELQRRVFDPTAVAFGSPAISDAIRHNYVEPWAVGQNLTVRDKESGQQFSRWIRYDTSRSTQSFAAMGSTDRQLYTDLMVGAGLLPEGYEGISDFTAEGASAFTEATRWANYYGTTVKEYLQNQSALVEKLSSGRGGGGGGAGRRYTIEVPDYDTITQVVKDMMRQKLRRDPKNWELSLVADEMQRQYGSWADVQKRKALGGNGVYEVPDPNELTEAFVESKYEDEISRLDDVEQRAQNNQLLVRAATAGGALNSGTSRRLQ